MRNADTTLRSGVPRALTALSSGFCLLVGGLLPTHAMPPPTPAVERAMAFVTQDTAQFGSGTCSIRWESRSSPPDTFSISSTVHFTGWRVEITQRWTKDGTPSIPVTYSFRMDALMPISVGSNARYCAGGGKAIELQCRQSEWCIAVSSGGATLPPVKDIELQIFDGRQGDRVSLALSVVQDPTCAFQPGCKF